MNGEIIKLVFADSGDCKVSATEFTDFYSGSNFSNDKEKKLLNTLISTLIELKFSFKKYNSIYSHIFDNPTAGMIHYMKEISGDYSKNHVQFELRNTELQYHFKFFIILTKSVLDKLVPFFDLKHNSGLKKYTNCGEKISKTLIHSSKNPNKESFVKFIEEEKQKWIYDLIKMRDNYTHYSELPQYKDFHLLATTDNYSITSLKDFQVPQLEINNNNKILVHKYLENTMNNLSEFSCNFLKFSGYELNK